MGKKIQRTRRKGGSFACMDTRLPREKRKEAHLPRALEHTPERRRTKERHEIQHTNPRLKRKERQTRPQSPLRNRQRQTRNLLQNHRVREEIKKPPVKSRRLSLSQTATVISEEHREISRPPTQKDFVAHKKVRFFHCE